jgi:predicted O-methyltransferase YrrM
MSQKSADLFEPIRMAANAHRGRHGCGAYPYNNGALLGALAAAVGAQRVLELGTALGYTALWFAHGAPRAKVDTIEGDPEHVRLAREHIATTGYADRVVVHEGDFAAVLAGLEPSYDVAFFDGFTPSPSVQLALRQLLRPRGLLISANLTHRGKDVKAYVAALLDQHAWLTAFVDGERETAVSVKL